MTIAEFDNKEFYRQWCCVRNTWYSGSIGRILFRDVSGTFYNNEISFSFPFALWDWTSGIKDVTYDQPGIRGFAIRIGRDGIDEYGRPYRPVTFYQIHTTRALHLGRPHFGTLRTIRTGIFDPVIGRGLPLQIECSVNRPNARYQITEQDTIVVHIRLDAILEHIPRRHQLRLINNNTQVINRKGEILPFRIRPWPQGYDHLRKPTAEVVPLIKSRMDRWLRVVARQSAFKIPRQPSAEGTQMTDRISHLTVALENDIREDDIEPLIKAIKMLKWVRSVKANVADDALWTVKERNELRQKLYDLASKLGEKVDQ